MRLPDDPIHRRRLAALATTAAVATAAGVFIGAGHEGSDRASTQGSDLVSTQAAPVTTAASSRQAPEPDPPADAAQRAEAPSGARLQREAGQTVVMRFAGTTVPGYVLRALRERRAAGVILFADNVSTPARLRAMTRAIRRASGGRALIMVDQEGGTVRRIPWASPRGPASEVRTTAAATAVAQAAARDLRAAGVNVNLAPVADVATWPRSVMRGRAFPGDGAQVGRLVAATVRGYEAGGIHATVKHFPGFGRSTKNTDFEPATVPGRGDLEPYRAAIRAGVPLVMASHALHPELDPDRIVSQSRRTLTGLLRDELGFEGACVTDALEARAVLARSSVPSAALRSMRAGCDLLLTTKPGSYLPVLRALVASARRDPGLRGRLRQARGRITRLRR